MRQRILNMLNIKVSESNQVLDLLSVQFFIGLATAFLNTISFTLFIYTFPATELPLVYLTVAGTLIVLNFFYEKLEHSFSPFQLLKLIIALGTGLLILLWAGMQFGHSETFIFALMVANTVIYMVTGYAFWGLVSLLFNVRESRRVFSIVGAGDIPAKLVGYVVAPLLIPLVGVQNVIWLAILSFGCSLLVFRRLLKKSSWDTIRKKFSHSHQQHTGHQQHPPSQNIVTFFFENRLIFAISLLSILSYNVFILVDYTFIAQVKMKFSNITELAAWLAAFFAVGRVIAIVFKLIFTSRVIEKLGLISTLLVTPLALALSCLVFFFVDDYPKYMVFIFGMMALLTEILRSTMQEPVFFVLFQPLKEHLRLKGHLIAKGYTMPPSLIVVGASLLLFYQLDINLSILLTIKIIIINLIIWAAVIFLIQKTYLHTLHHSIKRGMFNTDDRYINDRQTINILLDKVRQGSGTDVIYALDLLKKSAYEGLPALLLEQLRSNKGQEVKQYALEQLENIGIADTALLHELMAMETDPELKPRLVTLLCQHDADFLRDIADRLSEQEAPVRKALIIHLLNQHEFQYLLRAGNEIDRLIHAADPEERKLSLEIITEIRHVHFSHIIANLMQDADPAVKRMAVLAACKLRILALLPQILQLGEEVAHKPLVIKALALYGDQLFEDIRTLPDTTMANYLPELIRISPGIKGEHCRAFLLEQIGSMNEHTHKIIHALWSHNYVPAGTQEKKQLQELLHAFLKLGCGKISDCYHANGYTHFNAMVKNSLLNEIRTDLVAALRICSLLYGKRSVNRILEMIQVDKHEKIFNALEMIELELPKKISKDIISMVDFILDPEESRTTTLRNELPLFEKVYNGEAYAYNPWTRSALLYAAWKNREAGLAAVAARPLHSGEHYIVSETRQFVLTHIPE
jgi:ATP:ADP antiporter, AAA family